MGVLEKGGEGGARSVFRADLSARAIMDGPRRGPSSIAGRDREQTGALDSEQRQLHGAGALAAIVRCTLRVDVDGQEDGVRRVTVVALRGTGVVSTVSSSRRHNRLKFRACRDGQRLRGLLGHHAFDARVAAVEKSYHRVPASAFMPRPVRVQRYACGVAQAVVPTDRTTRMQAVRRGDCLRRRNEVGVRPVERAMEVGHLQE